MNCNCKHGEYHGYPPKGSPSWAVSTVHFWCPVVKDHECRRYADKRFVRTCEYYEEGTPKKFDKRGNELRGQQ